MINKPQAYLYKMPQSTMQSGLAGSKSWILKFDPRDHQFVESIMQWTGSMDTQSQVTIKFKSLAAAQQFIAHHNISVRVMTDNHRHIIPKNYSDNFMKPRG